MGEMMKKISDITLYVDENDEFTDGAPATGGKPTPLLAAWFNVIQRELVKVVEGAGLTLDPTDDTQLWQALSKYFASQENVNAATGSLQESVNAAIGALGTMASQNSDAVNITGGAIRDASLTGDLTGNADTATKLKTGRTIQTNLESTSAASFNGSANITPGVTGTLPVGSGGTGATTASEARKNLELGDVATYSLSSLDSRYLQTKNTASKAANGWFKDEVTGVIMQWGYLSSASSGLTFPIAFPSACTSITIANAHGRADYSIALNTLSNTGATFYSENNGNMYWTAVGY